MTALTVSSLVAPLLAAVLLWFPVTRTLASRIAPWAPLPALALALAAPIPYEIELPWLLLGTRLGLDETGRVFLLLTSLIWLAAGVYARAWLADDPRRHTFAGFFLLAAAGNLGVCLALDAPAFYFCFALMSLSAYGLVVHEHSAAASRAGRVYLVLAITGEALILAGLMLAAAGHPLAAASLIAGFGAKTGLPLLHVALPLAYAAAPPPAAAALAGAMINAGLLGWLRFLPLGDAVLPEAGSALMLAGLAAIALGSLVGLAQRDPGALLAYSSVAQMGQLALAVGAGLVAPPLWPLLAPAVALYALHHALAKAALFLGLGVLARRGPTRAVLLGMALPALALAGAPLTSGLLAKSGLKQALLGAPAPWSDLVPLALTLGALGTALLMLRLLWLARSSMVRPDASIAGLVAPWLLMLAGVAGLAAWLAPAATWHAAWTVPAALAATWPVLAAVALAFAARRLELRAPPVPPGDALALLERLRAASWRRPVVRHRALPAVPHAAARTSQAEARLRSGSLAGLLWLASVAVLAVLLAR